MTQIPFIPEAGEFAAPSQPQRFCHHHSIHLMSDDLD
jgi:hypothetical protein